MEGRDKRKVQPFGPALHPSSVKRVCKVPVVKLLFSFLSLLSIPFVSSFLVSKIRKCGKDRVQESLILKVNQRARERQIKFVPGHVSTRRVTLVYVLRMLKKTMSVFTFSRKEDSQVPVVGK